MFSADGLSVVEWLEIVEHLVVDAIDDRAHDVLEQFEVEQQAGGVELGSGQGDTDLVVVAVRVFALPL